MMDTNTNLCDSCCNCIATCIPKVISYGVGKGHDNVIHCSGYNDPKTPKLPSEATKMEYKMKTKPWAHQLKALNYLFPRDIGALYTKPGSGKTKVMIDLIVNRGFKSVIVVAPLKPCDVWVDEIKIHSDIPAESVHLLYKMSTADKLAHLKNTHLGTRERKTDTVDIFIVNYQSIWREPFASFLMRKSFPIDCVICDESHRIKTPGSKCSRFLARLGKKVQCRYNLTGTPLAEQPTDVYAQYRFLDSSIFGTNFGNFCNEYENLDPILTARIGHPILDKKNPYKNLDELKEKMFSCAFYIKPDIKLPPHKSKIVYFEPSEQLEAIYKEFSRTGIVEIGKKVLEAENVLAMITRKQQLTSGYAHVEDEDGNEHLKRIDNSRKMCLYHLIKKMGNEPIVVFAKFRKDFKAIRSIANHLGCGYSEVSGVEDTLEDWKAGKTQIIGVQYSSGSEAISLVRSHICIYYSLTHSLLLYTQSRKRVHRPGQTKPVTYYHIVCRMGKARTIDEEILSCLKAKKDIVQEIMKHPPH